MICILHYIKLHMTSMKRHYKSASMKEEVNEDQANDNSTHNNKSDTLPKTTGL